MDSDDLHLFAQQQGVRVESAEWNEQTKSGTFGILQENLANKVGEGKVSYRKLNNLVRLAEKKFSGSFTYIIYPGESDAAVTNLAKTTIEMAYPNVTVKSISGWYTGILTIEVLVKSGSITRQELKHIETFSSLVLRRKTQIVGASSSAKIFPPAILKVIKKSSPVKLERLRVLLETEFAAEVTPDWLGNELDKLRKEGAVVRLRTGEYVLSLQTLKSKVLGSAYHRGDIERVLYLAKKKW